MTADILSLMSSAAAAGVVGWLGNAFLEERKNRATSRKADVDLETHRDGLTFDLLTAAREEMSAARREVDDLRTEVTKLRPLEQHLYNFQQALDHIEALLGSGTADERQVNERNARAFLNRMRRLNEAKGTIANEVQIADSAAALVERNIIIPEPPKPPRQSRTKRKDP